jgi:predicted MFS family arabinose efflux permease
MLSRTATLYKTSFTGLSRETWLLSLVMLVNRSGTMVRPYMTLYLTDKNMGRSLSEAGLVISLFGLGSIIGAYFGGRITDKTGFHKVQLFTLFFGGVLFITLGQIKNYPLICICTFALSLVNEAFRPANSSAIAFYSSAENRTRSYSLNRLAINLGWAVGASFGGIIAAYNYQLLFWVDGVTNIFAAALLFYFLKPSKIQPRPKTEEAIPQAQSAYRDKTYLFFIFLMTVFALCFFQMFTTVPKYFRDELHLSEQFIGLTMAVNGGLIVLIEMVLIYSLEGKRKATDYIVFGLILCAIAFACLLIPGQGKLISMIMILFITFGEISSMPFMSSYWTSRANEKNRGQYAALFTISWGAGQTLGPFFSSLLVDATSFSVLFLTVIGLLLLTAVGFYNLGKNKPRPA